METLKWGSISKPVDDIFGEHTVQKIFATQAFVLLVTFTLLKPRFLMTQAMETRVPTLHVLKVLILSLVITVGTCHLPTVLRR